MPNEVGSLLDNVVENTPIFVESSEPTTETVSEDNAKDYGELVKNLDKMMSNHLDGSVRLIGAPHQFLKHNDNRYGNSTIGRMYAEKIIMEAPRVYIKPGVSEFLPGKNSKEKDGWRKALAGYAGGDKDAILKKLNSEEDDLIQYFGIKADYSGYMNKVNMLCRMLATMLGIADFKIPWGTGNATFGNYDWRAYKMSSQYGNLKMDRESSGFAAFTDFLAGTEDSLMNDYEYIQFYVTPDSNYSQSFSNSTTTSVLENITDQLEGVAKELQVISSMSGMDITGLADSASSSLNQYISENASDGPIGTMLKRITGASKQVINGGNFVLPEIWSSSSSDSSFSFSMHLVTPYGNKLAWFINIGVPMMFAIAMCLPVQQTANVIASPYLLKCFSPGWFSTSMGIVDSLTIEKASDGTWNKAGLPNDVTIRISVKDLYSHVSLPASDSAAQFMANTGMLEFLLTSAGVDISRQDIGDKWNIWLSLFENKFSNLVQKNVYDATMLFKHKASNLFRLFNQ